MTDANCDFHVVGVGASAGGLEALEAFFREMPTDTGAAFVVIQHLSPDFKSHMEQLLARQTEIPVFRVEDGMEVKPNCIYLIPAKKEMIISEGKLLLTDKDTKSLAHPIDQFFRSLANDCGKFAVGVILSGTGSDGSRGIRDIHEAGGLVIAQSEDTAKFDGMPLNAQETGIVDVVLAPSAMAVAINKYVKDSLSPEQLAEAEIPQAQLEGIQRVFQLLRAEFRLDFTHYKPATVARRVNRRVELNNYSELQSYVERLQEDRAELNDLYKDLLIGVTRFFRDAEAFKRLEEDVIPSILEKTAATDQVRVWVAGCATGEEAYSIAMLFHEQLTAAGRPLNFKMFATDVHRASIQTAAQGVYSEKSIDEVSAQRRDRYFQQKDGNFHVVPELRQMIVFAPHNVISDAPFTQLNLVTCRNLLIYLQPMAQKKALSLFHFALKTGATMMLGPSETPGEITDEFEVVDKRWKVYIKRRDVRLPPEMRLPLEVSQMPRAGTQPRAARSPSFDNQLLATYDRLLEQHMPPSFLVDEQFELVHTFGGAERFLQRRGGRTSTSIIDLIHPDLKTSLSGALQHALKDDSAVRYTGIRVQHDESNVEQVHLVVQPMHDPRTKVINLVVKLESVSPAIAELPDVVNDLCVDDLTQEHIQSLETELRFTRENLQATIEELETANEELQATNEELVASNEELQSTNEELHSVNEELYTVNSEHQKKIEQLTEANDDMDNLLETTQVGVLFLDRDLCVRRFTPEIAKILDLLPHDIGRRISSFGHNLIGGNFVESIRQVQDTSQPQELEVTDLQGTPYFLRIVPYQTGGRAAGVVLALLDIGSLKEAQADVERFAAVVNSSTDFVGAADPELNVIQLNPAGRKMLGLPKEADASKLKVSDLHSEEEFQRLKMEAIPAAIENGIWTGETKLRDVNGEDILVSQTVLAHRKPDGELSHVSTIARDIREQRKTELAIRESEQFLRRTLDSLFVFAGVCSPDGILIEANRPALLAAGLQPSDVIGKPFEETYWWSYSKEVQRDLRDAIHRAAKGETIRYDVEVRLEEDVRLPIDFQLTPMRDEDGNITHLVPSAIDITERLSADQRLATEHAVTHILAEEVAVETAVTRILNSFMENLDVDIAEYWSLDHDDNRLKLAQHYVSEEMGSARDWSSERQELKLRKGEGLAGIVWNEKQPAWMSNVKDEMRGHPYLVEQVGIRTGYAIPVAYKKEFFGALCFLTRSELETNKPLLTMLTAVGVEIGQFFVRLRSEREVRLRDRAIANATNGVVIADATQEDTPIVYVNRGFEKITGYSTAEAIGKNCRFLQGPESSANARKQLREAVRHKKECRVTIANYKKDGALFWNDLHIAPVEDETGCVSHFVAVQNDVTRRKRIEERLREAEKTATAANAAKTAFLANVSHELRTPLSAILGFADILKESVTSESDRDAAATIRRNGDYLLELVNDILDLSKVEADRLEVRREDCDLPDLLSDVIKLMSVRADQNGVPLRLEFKTTIPKSIRTDRTRLRQILVNLLSNAIKFTEKGEVRLVVDCAPACETNGKQSMLGFRVIDTGIGMSEETMQKLFRPFSQADFDVTQRFGGTGLGLSISKRLTERLGGDLTVESELGKGTEFLLSLPIEEPCDAESLIDPNSTKRPLMESTSEPNPQLTCRVLVADDRRDIWRVCRYFLEGAGATVEIAEDGQQALDLVEKFESENDPFDIVLMDMQMPVLTGYDATRSLRKSGFEAPIIALTAGAMKGDRERCLEAGCTDYFAKPIDGNRLVRLVHAFMTPIPQAADTTNRTDLQEQLATSGDVKRILLVEDFPDVCKLMHQLLSGMGHEVRSALNAAEAIQIADEFDADVFLLDLTLPDMDGFRLAEKLRQNASGRKARFIAVTGHDLGGRNELRPFDDHILKPVTPAALSQAILMQD